jgi:hypothetical protein
MTYSRLNFLFQNQLLKIICMGQAVLGITYIAARMVEATIIMEEADLITIKMVGMAVRVRGTIQPQIMDGIIITEDGMAVIIAGETNLL